MSSILLFPYCLDTAIGDISPYTSVCLLLMRNPTKQVFDRRLGLALYFRQFFLQGYLAANRASQVTCLSRNASNANEHITISADIRKGNGWFIWIVHPLS
mmetsp:Transcript_16484/g.23949  ORF Transcript_16484/g.23949 Transcript_16484/m.23949 type:complete len:100 (-) Transcript_16484:181-480(-)